MSLIKKNHDIFDVWLKAAFFHNQSTVLPLFFFFAACLKSRGQCVWSRTRRL